MGIDYRVQLHLICGHKANPLLHIEIEKLIGEEFPCVKCMDFQRCIRIIILDNQYAGHRKD